MSCLMRFILLVFPAFASNRSLSSSNVYVLIPDVHQSGGPACLHELHNKLNQLNFNSFMFNLIGQYSTEYSRPIQIPPLIDNKIQSMQDVRSLKPIVVSHLLQVLTKSDILVLPVNWISSNYFTESEMKSFSNTGARTFVYLLGVANPHDFVIDSNNGHGLVVGFRLSEVTQRYAPILPLSDYILHYYDLPNNPMKHVLLSPLENIYYIMHKEYMKLSVDERLANKKDIILLDSDLKGDIYVPDYILESYQIVILRDFNTNELIELYKEAKIIIDLHFNGPERVIWEAILFDCYPVIAHQGNGGNDIDIPIPSMYKIDSIDADLNHYGPNGPTSNLYNSVDVILNKFDTDPNKLRLEFSTFQLKVLSLPRIFENNVKHTFSSSVVTFVLGTHFKKTRLMPRLQRSKKEMLLYESNVISCLISILFHLPMATVIIHVSHVQDFLRRHQRLFRELTELGLSNDENGGEIYHSIRVLPPIDNDDDTDISNFHRGEVSITIKKGMFVLLGTKTVFDTVACLESHSFGQIAGISLNDGSTELNAKLIQMTSQKRLNQLEKCQLNYLSDILDVSLQTRKHAITTDQQSQLNILNASPLGRLTGVFEKIV